MNRTVSAPRQRPWPFWLVYVMDGSTVVRRVRGLSRQGVMRRARYCSPHCRKQQPDRPVDCPWLCELAFRCRDFASLDASLTRAAVPRADSALELNRRPCPDCGSNLNSGQSVGQGRRIYRCFTCGHTFPMWREIG